MDLSQFLKKLESKADKFDWFYVDGKIRGKRGDGYYCPLTALAALSNSKFATVVCKSKKRESCFPNLACEALKFYGANAARVMEASDVTVFAMKDKSLVVLRRLLIGLCKPGKKLPKGAKRKPSYYGYEERNRRYWMLAETTRGKQLGVQPDPFFDDKSKKRGGRYSDSPQSKSAGKRRVRKVDDDGLSEARSVVRKASLEE